MLHIINNERHKCEKVPYIDGNNDLRFQLHESLEPYIWANVKGRKKLMPTCVLGWIRAALQNGNGSRWARYVRLELTGVRHIVVESWPREELAGGSQLRSLRGVSVLSHPTTVTAPVGAPEAPRYHWFFLLVFPFSTWISWAFSCLHNHTINSSSFPRRIEYATRNLCQ